MDVRGVREAILEMTSYYFKNATVTFTRQSHVAKQGKPLVAISTGSVSRPLNPTTKIVDGRPVSFYPSTMPIQIDLFTKGRQRKLAEGFTSAMEDTAEDDMLVFANFLNSEYATQFCHQKDIAIVVPNTVQNLSGLINDTAYEFRAMLEIVVYFTMEAIGYSAVLAPSSVKHNSIDPETGEPVGGGDIQADDVIALVPEIEETVSGGGNEEMVANEEGYFTNVEINNKPVKEENDNEF